MSDTMDAAVGLAVAAVMASRKRSPKATKRCARRVGRAMALLDGDGDISALANRQSALVDGIRASVRTNAVAALLRQCMICGACGKHAP